MNQIYSTTSETIERPNRKFRLLSWLPPSVATYVYTVILAPKPLRALSQALIKCIIPEKIRLYDVDLLLNQEDAVVSGALALGCYETRLLGCFKAAVKPGMTVIDIGANIGLYTVISASAVGDKGRVIAIEPDVHNCSFIKRSLSLNAFENVHIIQKAIGDTNETISLFLCDNNKADHRVYDRTGTRRAVPVEIVTLDSLLRTENISCVDIIKMDVQGYEAYAFSGMSEIIKLNPKIKIFMEFWPWGLQQAGSDPKRLLATIRSLHFRIYEFRDTTGTFAEITDDEELSGRELERQHANLLLSQS